MVVEEADMSCYFSWWQQQAGVMAALGIGRPAKGIEKKRAAAREERGGNDGPDDDVVVLCLMMDGIMCLCKAYTDKQWSQRDLILLQPSPLQ